MRRQAALCGAVVLLIIGLFALASPEPDAISFIASQPLGVATIVGGWRIILGRNDDGSDQRWRGLDFWSFSLLSIAAGNVLAVPLSIVVGSSVDVVLIHFAVAGLSVAAVKYTRPLQRQVQGSIPLTLWSRFTGMINRAAGGNRVEDPLSRWLQRRGLTGLMLWVSVSLLMLVFVMAFVYAAIGSENVDRLDIDNFVLTYGIPTLLASMALFPLAQAHGHATKRLFTSAALRCRNPKCGTSALEIGELSGRCRRVIVGGQRGLFKLLLYGWIVFLPAWGLYGIACLIDPSISSGFSGIYEDRIVGSLYVLNVIVFSLVAGAFVYLLITLTIRSVVVIVFLIQTHRSFVLCASEEHSDGFGGLGALGDYALTMLVLPILFACWTSVRVFADRGADELVASQVIDLSPYYAFELTLLCVGFVIPMIIGRKLQIAAKWRRISQLALERRSTFPNSARSELLRKQIHDVERISNWPLGKTFGLTISGAAILMSIALQLGEGPANLMGPPYLAFAVSILGLMLALTTLLAGAGAAFRPLALRRRERS